MVVLPVFDDPHDEDAILTYKRLFPIARSSPCPDARSCSAAVTCTASHSRNPRGRTGENQVHMSAGDRREALIAAAVRAIRGGNAGVQHRTVATEAGVSTGLMHHYFASYDDLMAAVSNGSRPRIQRAGRWWRRCRPQ